jgi:hypothetical protein
MESRPPDLSVNIPNNVFVHVLGYLCNREILRTKLVSRRFYTLLSDRAYLTRCIDIQFPKLATENIRGCLGAYIQNDANTSSSQVRTTLDKHIGHGNLLMLNLDELGIHSEPVMTIVCAALAEQPHFIERLSLSNNNLAERTLNPLLHYLLHSWQLKHLNLQATKLCKTNIEDLCEVVAAHKGLESLNVSGNVLGRDGASRIAHMLSRNRALQKLYLIRTSIGNEGAATIFEGLVNNTTLRRLHIEENKVSAKTGKTIKSFNTLTKVYL